MQFLGELISISVAISWTLSALFFEFAGKRIGSLSVNLIRLIFAFFLLGAALYFYTGSILPSGANYATWVWMILSGLVGFVFGDLCLFYSYLLITSRFSQLIMTLAPPFAAFFGWIILGENLSASGFIGMTVTLFGIAISIVKRGDEKSEGVPVNANSNKSAKLKINLPLKGVLLAVGGALGQGLGIVLSKQGMIEYQLSLGQGSELSQYVPFAATQIRIITGIVGFGIIIIVTKRFLKFKEAFSDKKGISATFLGSIFGPFIGVSLSLMAVQYTNTAVASTIMATTPVIILFPYMIIYKKRVSVVEIFGAVVSVIGVSLFFVDFGF